MQLIQTARENIRSLFEQCNVPFENTPFNEALYQECVDDAMRRGYPVEGDPSVRTYLRLGVALSETVAHLHHRPTQIWIALYSSCAIFIDDAPDHFPAELPGIYLFNERFIKWESQGNCILDAFADLTRRIPDLYRPIASHLVTTATLNFVAATLLEHETRFMMISKAAQQYPAYQRIMSGSAETFGFALFPQDVPMNDYIQAIPEIVAFVNGANDVLSFYKEERVGETTNQISTLAARSKKSKLEIFSELTQTTVSFYKRTIEILEGSPEACEAIKQFTTQYLRFHTSIPRYHLEELDL